MCDLSHSHEGRQFGFIVDVPDVRALIEETQKLTKAIATEAARVDALRPAFARLLAAEGWLPDEFARPDLTSGMGGGIGQYALYSLLPPDGDIHYVKTVSATPSVSIHLLANDTACVWRHRFDPRAGTVTPFRSGYSNVKCPPEDAAAR